MIADSVLFPDLSEDQLKLLPTELEVQLYESKGWYVSPVILDDYMIAAARKGVEEFYQNKIDFDFKLSERVANDVPNSEATLLNNEFVTLQKKQLKELGFNKLIVATAAKLARTNEIRLFADSLINKKPTNTTAKNIVGWHSDKAYWPTCSSDQMLTAWIPLQDIKPDMGTLTHIDESNTWVVEQNLKRFFSFNNQDLSELESFLTEKKPDHVKSPMLLKQGQVSFHNCHTIHSSSPNLSNKERIALAIHFQDGQNKYQKAFKENGELIQIGYDHMCGVDSDGNPDYSDPNLFPSLWRAND
ncbi:MAG: phytanoyl-CoA dioxygenase family protein [Cyclobacteriaceae bacterium]